MKCSQLKELGFDFFKAAKKIIQNLGKSSNGIYCNKKKYIFFISYM